MESELVDMGILSMSMVAIIFAFLMLLNEMTIFFAPLFLGILGFIYLKIDMAQINRQLISQNESSTDTEENALALLRERYAQGEIDQAEFETRLNDLLETESIEQAENHRNEPITEHS